MKEILLRGGGYLTIHSRRVSLQEAGKSPNAAVKEILSEARRLQRSNSTIQSAYFNVLLALRTDRFRRMQRADEYLSHFVAQNWQIMSLALLSPDSRDEQVYTRFGAPICYIYDSTTAFSISPNGGPSSKSF